MAGRRTRWLLAAMTVVALASAVAAGATSGDIHQSFDASLRADGDVRTTLSYAIPDRVTRLRVTLPVVETGGARVTSVSGFRRTGAATFAWTGADDPSIELALSADGSRVLSGDGWAFAVRPDVSLTYGYRGAEPGVRTSFDVFGTGYAADVLAYLGPSRAETVTAAGESTTFVVARDVEGGNLSAATDFLREAPGRFDLGVRRPTTTAFVLPARRAPPSGPRIAGSAVETAFWVGPEALSFDTTETTFAHEYVHTRLGVVGTGSAGWLTEGAAEYFGNAFALNAGAGDYAGFRAALAADRFAPERRPVTLSSRGSWEGTLANYDKGALVLAALDARIRRSTDGRRTLADVFADHPGTFDGHADFRRAVVTTADDPTIGDWLDRYVTTDALPALPHDPASFVYGPDLDPDGDGVESGVERERGTNPFVAAASTAESSATGTPSVTTGRTTTAPATAAPRRTTERPATDGGPTLADGPGPGVGGTLVALALAMLVATTAARWRR